MTTKSLGKEGFIWFIGVVEDRNDPLKLGRVKVRIYDFHTSNKALMPTEEIPWAIIMMPGYSPSSSKVGISPTGLTIGSTVIGFFMDGNDANQPVVIGTIHGIPGKVVANHDVSPVARETNNIVKQYDSLEPGSAYNAKYPYNKTFQTEGGHVVEFDDTPGNERIHVYHKSGTYTEIDKDGRQVDKVVGDHYEIVIKNQVIHIKGNQTIKIDGNVKTLVDGTYTLESKGNMLIKAPRIDFNPDEGGAVIDVTPPPAAQAEPVTEDQVIALSVALG